MTINRLVRLVAPLFVVAAAIVVFYPGAMSPDSFAALRQARSLVLDDGHPPLLALLWHPLDQLWPGPIGILILNLSTYYVGLALTLAATGAIARLREIPVYLFLSLWPPIFGIIGAIWTDITMEAFLLLSLGLFLLRQRLLDRRAGFAALLASIVCLFLATGFRHNAAAAAAPLAIFYAWRLTAGRAASLRWLVALGGLAATILSFWLHGLITAAVISEPSRFTEWLAIYDIAGVSVRLDQDLFDPVLFPQNTLHDIKVLYTPRSVIPLQIGQQIHQPPPFLSASAFLPGWAPDFTGTLWRNWWQVVSSHPILYLAHRLAVFEEVLGTTRSALWVPVYNIVEDNNLGVQVRSQRALWYNNYANWVMRQTYLFVPAFYFGAALVLLIALRWVRSPRGPVIGALILSGLAYESTLFFFAMSPDYRYSHWLVTTMTVALALVLPEFLSSARLAASGWRSARHA